MRTLGSEASISFFRVLGLGLRVYEDAMTGLQKPMGRNAVRLSVMTLNPQPKDLEPQHEA